jgi:phospholipase C
MPPSPSGAAGLSTVETADEVFKNTVPFGLGMRVPMLAISPWSRGGWVCSQVFDHTSVIRFLEARFGVQEPNISAWRRTVCGDLTSAFDFARPNAHVATLPDTSHTITAKPNTASVKIPPVPGSQTMPGQLPGTRPSRALPYVLAAHARLDKAQGRVWVDFINTGPAGAVFQVYPRKPDSLPRVYTVGAGKTLSDSWKMPDAPPAAYDLSVYGPNGFLRVMRGDLIAETSADAAHIDLTITADAATSSLVLHLANSGTVAGALTLIANAYAPKSAVSITVPAGGAHEHRWAVDASSGWYDVTINGPAGFLRRIAGHLETGKPGTTDPAIGAIIPAAPFDVVTPP